MLPSQPFTKLKFMVTKFVLCLKQLASFFLEFYHQPVVIFSQVMIGLSDSINFTSFDGKWFKVLDHLACEWTYLPVIPLLPPCPTLSGSSLEEERHWELDFPIVCINLLTVS